MHCCCCCCFFPCPALRRTTSCCCSHFVCNYCCSCAPWRTRQQQRRLCYCCCCCCCAAAAAGVAQVVPGAGLAPVMPPIAVDPDLSVQTLQQRNVVRDLLAPTPHYSYSAHSPDGAAAAPVVPKKNSRFLVSGQQASLDRFASENPNL